MSVVCYEKTKEGLVLHVTRNHKTTVCGEVASDTAWQEAKKEIYCKKCWAKFNG